MKHRSVIYVLAVVLVALVTGSAVSGYVRAQQAITASQQGRADSIRTRVALEDCVIPGGKCYARGQQQTAQAVTAISAGSSANHALLLQVQAELSRIEADLHLAPATTPTATQTRPGAASKPTPFLRAKVAALRAPAPRPVEHIIPGLSLSPRPSRPASSGGCAAALAYLASHEAPGFTARCAPVEAGHAASTEGTQYGGTITIDPRYAGCSNAYRNEAANSHSFAAGVFSGPAIDPYGSCPPAAG